MERGENKGFWGKLTKPFFVLAPLADVTDPAFRRIIAKYGAPDVMWTEFVSADGLFLADEKGRDKIARDLEYTEAERPIVAQFFSSRPDMMKKAAVYAVEHGFDGFDINMGCPDRSIEKQCAGAALIKDPALAKELIAAAKEGIQEAGGNIPVSVKTRLGYNTNIIDQWLPHLLEAKPVAVTIHARTRKEMSKVPAQWDEIAKAVRIRDELGSDAFILGNGDVVDLEDAQKKVDETRCDGVMLGRAIFGNPWLFAGLQEEMKRGMKTKSYDISYDSERSEERPDNTNTMIYHSMNSSVSIEERLRVMVEHTKLFEELLGDMKSFAIMKKHYKAYVNGWSSAKELRMKLMEAQDASEVGRIVNEYLKGKDTML